MGHLNPKVREYRRMNREFCEVCCHHVNEMERHIKSQDHKRQEKKKAGKGYKAHSPRLPIGVNRAATGSGY